MAGDDEMSNTLGERFNRETWTTKVSLTHSKAHVRRVGKFGSIWAKLLVDLVERDPYQHWTRPSRPKAVHGSNYCGCDKRILSVTASFAPPDGALCNSGLQGETHRQHPSDLINRMLLIISSSANSSDSGDQISWPSLQVAGKCAFVIWWSNNRSNW